MVRKGSPVRVRSWAWVKQRRARLIQPAETRLASSAPATPPTPAPARGVRRQHGPRRPARPFCLVVGGRPAARTTASVYEQAHAYIALRSDSEWEASSTATPV